MKIFPPLFGCCLLLASPTQGGSPPAIPAHFIVDTSVELLLTEATVTFDVSNIAPGQIGTDTKTTTYDFSSNAAASQKITVTLDGDMPAGTGLQLQPEGPQGATAIAVPLTSSTVDCVRDITPANQLGLQLRYTFSANISSKVGTFSRGITYTVVAQ